VNRSTRFSSLRILHVLWRLWDHQGRWYFWDRRTQCVGTDGPKPVHTHKDGLGSGKRTDMPNVSRMPKVKTRLFVRRQVSAS
jgi:hypothetical protein